MALRDEYVFYCNDLPKRSFSFWGNKRTEFCDITFKVGGRPISAHRIILSAAIPFFYKVFSDKQTADAENKEIAFPDIDSDAFESLIEYAYKCKVKISMENVKMLLSGACFLQMDEVKNACCQFLIDRLNAKNVLDIRSHSSSLDYAELTENIDRFIINNFSEIMMTEKFLNISFTLLNKLICSDELNVKNEEIVIEGVLKWVKNCPEERKENLLDLLKNIRFPFLDARYIRNYVTKEELIRSSHACRDLIDEVTFYHFLPEERKEICSFPTSPRCLVMNCQKRDVVKENLSICILFEGEENVVHSFDLVNEKWMLRKINGNLVRLSYYHAVVALDKKMYCFLDDVTQILNLETNSYSSCGSMKYLRVFTGSVVHKNKVFICGGYVRQSASNVVECFDPQTEDFIQLRCMNTCRGGPGATTYEEFIYVLGGWNGIYQHSTNSVEKYNVKTGMWSTSSPMFTARAYFGCCTLKDKMYVCGGQNKLQLISTTEVFDFNTNEWKFIAPMKNLIRNCKLVSFCNKLYAFGKCSHYYIYEQETDKWIVGQTLYKDSEVVGAAVISLPSL